LPYNYSSTVLETSLCVAVGDISVHMSVNVWAAWCWLCCWCFATTQWADRYSKACSQP